MPAIIAVMALGIFTLFFPPNINPLPFLLVIPLGDDWPKD
jgi:hypothetical protein